MEIDQETREPSPMHSKPQHEHRWLRQLVGDWKFEGGSSSSDDRTEGTETVRPIGDLWVAGEARGSMPGGGDAEMIITLGFDPQKNRFVGTWIGSMMTHLWIYDGTLDAAGKVLTLDTEGPDFSGGTKMVKYQDMIEFISDDHRTLSSRLRGEDGNWHQFMTAHYHRKK